MLVQEEVTLEEEEEEIIPEPMILGINACPVKEEVVAPYWANNTRGEVLALLNLYPFEQYVHWEKCTYEHRQMYCRDGCRCEQQYRLHRLLAFDPNNECRGIFSDWFKFPSCCVCKCYDLPRSYYNARRISRVYREELELLPLEDDGEDNPVINNETWNPDEEPTKKEHWKRYDYAHDSRKNNERQKTKDEQRRYDYSHMTWTVLAGKPPKEKEEQKVEHKEKVVKEPEP